MANKAAVITLSGALAGLANRDRTAPLPMPVLSTITVALSYTHLHFNYGPSAYNPLTGQSERVSSERRRLYQADEDGQLVFQRGFIPKVTQLLEGHGFAVELQHQPTGAEQRRDPEAYTADWDRVFSLFELRTLQDTCLAQLAMHDYGIVDAVPAFGKMYVIWMVAALFKRAKIDIVTKRRDVVQTMVRVGQRYVSSVGQVGGGKKTPARVTVYTADSLHHSDFDADIVLADEVHELATDNYAELLGRYQIARMFGFTGTTDTRMDNAHYRLEGLFGPPIFKLTHAEAEQHKLIVPIVVQWIDVNLSANPIALCKQSVAKKRHGIWRHEARNAVIAAATRELYSRGLQTLVLVDTVEHAVHLKQALPEFDLCYSEAGLDATKRQQYIQEGLLGEDEPQMTAQRRQAMRVAFERRELMGVIATGVWAVGVSFDGLELLVRANGGASKTENVQLPGRVGRTDDATGKEYGLLLDFYDAWDPGYRKRAQTRRTEYAKLGWEQRLANGATFEPRGGGRGQL